MLSILPFVNVRLTEFPVLVRLVNAHKEALSLLVLRQMEKDLDDTRAIAVEVLFQVNDGAVPVIPDCSLVKQLIREPLAAQNLRVRANDQHFLVVRAIEDTDSPAFRETAGGAPEEVVVQFLGSRPLEPEDLATLRIDPDVMCRIVPSFPAASMPWIISSSAYRRNA